MKDKSIEYYKSILESDSLSPDEKQRILDDDLKEHGDLYRQVLIESGIKPDLQVLKIRKPRKDRKTVVVPIKNGEGYSFVKVFDELKDLLRSNKLSKNAKLFIGNFTAFVSYPSNKIIIDGVEPSFEELMEMIGLNRNLLRKTINELEYYDVIKKIVKDGYHIYFNPFLVCGEGVCMSTFVLFKNSIYNIYAKEKKDSQ